jgi:hypothetical protein
MSDDIQEANRAIEQSATERQSSLIAQAVAEQTRLNAREEAGLEPGKPRELKPLPARDAGGKFAPSETKNQISQPETSSSSPDGAKPSPETAAAKPEQADGAVEPEPATSATVAKARRLESEGKFDEAFKLVFGKTLDELAPKAEHWHAWRQEKKVERAKVETERAEMSKQIEQIVSGYKPLVDARDALAAGDFDAFARHHGYADWNTLSRASFSQKMGAPVVSPDTKSLRDELAELRRELREEREAAKRAGEKSAAEREESERAESVAVSLSKSGDDRFERLSKNKAFVARIRDKQRQSNDGETQLSALEAAEEVWQELYADFVDPDSSKAGEKRDRGARAPESTDRNRNSAQPGGRRAARSVSTSAAPEAAPPQKFADKRELMDHFIRLEQSRIAAEDSGVG